MTSLHRLDGRVARMTTDAWALVAASLASLLTFVTLDAAWLSLVAIDLFQTQLGPILRPAPLVGAIVAFYLVYAAGLVVLAVRPALAGKSWRTAAALGAMLGLTAYATFDLTNLAVIDRWTVGLAVADITWGMAASTLTALAGYAAGRRMSPRRPPSS
jgi:uncharacterized membrane protein